MLTATQQRERRRGQDERKCLTGLSVLMSVYRGSVGAEVEAALVSVLEQTARAGEVVVVMDGPVREEVAEVIERRERGGQVRVVRLTENVGLGRALQAGMAACRGEIIARMDTDDVSVPERFEKQWVYLEAHPEVDLVGSWMATFEEDPGEVKFVRKGPVSTEEMRKVAAFRNPVNHPTVMFRRLAVEAVGGYRHFPGCEDWDLWVRMMQGGSRLATIPECLHKFRDTAAMVKRRGGWGLLKKHAALQKEFLRTGFITRGQYVRNLAVRTVAAFGPVWLLRRLRRGLRW